LTETGRDNLTPTETSESCCCPCRVQSLGREEKKDFKPNVQLLEDFISLKMRMLLHLEEEKFELFHMK
jgi:hypothetical protein